MRHGGPKRPDLFLAQNLRGGYLLIELKRPSKEIDRQDQRQAQEYRHQVLPHGHMFSTADEGVKDFLDAVLVRCEGDRQKG